MSKFNYKDLMEIIMTTIVIAGIAATVLYWGGV